MKKHTVKRLLNELLPIMIVLKLYRVSQGMEAWSDNMFFWIFLVTVTIWFPLKEGELQEYKRLRHMSNPLFYKGLFRKASKRPNGAHVLSELKGLYWRDIYVIFLIILLLLYSLYVKVTAKQVLNGNVILIWIVAVVVPDVCIVSYYEHILKKALKTKRKWGPFGFTTMGGGLAKRIAIKYDCFNKFWTDFKSVLKTNHYVYEMKYELAGNSSIRVFTRKRGISAEVFGIIYVSEMNEKHHVLMNAAFEKFLFKDSDLRKKVFWIHITYLVCVDTENSFFWGMVNSQVRQTGLRYRGLPLGASFDSKLIYIPRYYNHWGTRTIVKMQQKFCNMMELNE